MNVDTPRVTYLHVRVRWDKEEQVALYAFDGTWNSAKTDEAAQINDTNVVRFYQAYHRNSKIPAFDFYEAGVGTRFDLIGKLAGGRFGRGGLSRVNAACH